MKKIIMIFIGPSPFSDVGGFGRFFKDKNKGKNEGSFPEDIAHMLNATSEWIPKNPEDFEQKISPKIEKKEKLGGK